MNFVRVCVEEFCIVIGWEIFLVIVAFDSKWSDKERFWFEKLFDVVVGCLVLEMNDLCDMCDMYLYE